MFEPAFEPPIQPIILPNTTTRMDVYMKREDLFDPYISGNKWRKLKYVIEDAYNMGKKHLVSFGGAYSNHLVALAEAAHRYGFKSTAFVRGEPVSNHMLEFCKARNMNLIFVSRTSYKQKQVLFDAYFGQNRETYYIDEGGRSSLAAKGCEEILHQVSGFTHVITPLGTGTTLAGLANAALPLGIKAEGICVLKGAEAIDAEVHKLTSAPLHIHHGFSRRGYGKSDAELEDFMAQFWQLNGFALDSIYTGKMCMAVADLITSEYYTSKDKLILIHTGGLFANNNNVVYNYCK
jgi:1-aminocyclopropane-1-carboxylate deaminase